MPTISFIVAVADNGVIGRGDALPWRLKSDLRRFRKLTMGHPLIMGRKTFQSIGKPLEGRASIVVSRTAETPSQQADLYHVSSWPEALGTAKTWANEHNVHEIFVIGGAMLFQTALADCERIYLTQVHGAPEGDVTWDAPQPGQAWQEVSRVKREAGPEDEFAVTDIILERCK